MYPISPLAPLWTKIWKESLIWFHQQHIIPAPASSTCFSIWIPHSGDRCVYYSCLCLPAALCLCPSASVSLHWWPAFPQASCPCLLSTVHLTQNSFLREKRCQLYFWGDLSSSAITENVPKGHQKEETWFHVTRNWDFWFGLLHLFSPPTRFLFSRHTVLRPAHSSPNTLRWAEGTCWSLPSPKNYWLMVKSGVRQVWIWISDPPITHCMPCTKFI